MLYKTKKNLHKKMQGVLNFINESNKIINYFNYNIGNVNDIISSYITSDINYNQISITNTMTNIYKLWKNKNNIKTNIDNLLITIYSLDIINFFLKSIFQSLAINLFIYFEIEL